MVTEKQSVILKEPVQAHKAIKEVLWPWCKAMLTAGHCLVLEARKETRSTAQNRMLWSILRDLSKQVQWPVNGVLEWLSDEEWKDVLTAGLSKAQTLAQGINGGWVMLGKRTSKMTTSEMRELIDFAHYFGDTRGVNWSKTSLGREWNE